MTPTMKRIALLRECTGLPIEEMLCDAGRAINVVERDDAISRETVGNLGCHILALIDAIKELVPHEEAADDRRREGA